MKPFISILIFALSVAVVVFYIKPALPRIKALRQDIFFLEDTLESARELQSVRDKLLAKYNSFPPDDIERLHKLLPDNVDNVRLIIDIDEMASRYGLTIQDINIKQQQESRVRTAGAADEEAEDFGTSARTAREMSEAAEGLVEPKLSFLTLSFSVVASYERFLAFLRDMERSLRIVDVTEL
ncbi:MAG: hypothetical protein U1A28_00585, partial [Patescibacteria group bacterium]|nr:hypothetical protein [Patescibacteria group bacterium]